jgi:uncharacterized protein YjbI with pentapeptide repeats
MQRMEKAEARSRWKVAGLLGHGKQLLEEFRVGNVSHKTLRRHAGLTENGLIDLRGLSFDFGLRLEHIHITGLDLSFAVIPYSTFADCRFEDVQFAGIEADGWNERLCRLSDVSFRQACLRGAALGMRPSTYEQVDFTRADLRGAVFSAASFTRCDFSYAHLADIDFEASGFTECRFRGRLDHVKFRRVYRFPDDEIKIGKIPPNEMKQVDFSHAQLWDLVFSGNLDLSSVILPKDGSHILVEHFDLALENLSAEIDLCELPAQEKSKIWTLIRAYSIHATHQKMWILNKNEIYWRLGKELGNWFLANLVH